MGMGVVVVTGLGRVRRPNFTPPARKVSGWLCLGYVAVMLYSSTVVGPTGLNFVFQDPGKVLNQFLATRFVTHGSDQRADWIGNLLMLVPFGFLVAATIWPRRPALRLPAALSAIMICVTIILMLKYLQLFFPPRTVTLNYIVAQGVGGTIGCAAFAVWRERIGASVYQQGQVAALVLALRLYVAGLSIFLLMPLDFALNVTDLWALAERVPATILALPGGGDRPLALRLIVVDVASAAFIPVGMLLVFVKTRTYRVQRGLLAVTAMGLAVTTGIYVLSTLVLGIRPVMAAILYRTFGIMIGATMLRWLAVQDTTRLRHFLRAWVPWMILPYFVSVLLVNRLFSLQWLSLTDAIAQAYPLGMMPLFDYYIVSKAAAAKNIAGHVLLYMPIGVAIWLRYGRRGAPCAFIMAATLSLGVELGRYFQPGLEGDINAVAVAGLSALFTTRLMPAVWSMVTALAEPPAGTPAEL
jgi:VanZ family protein